MLSLRMRKRRSPQSKESAHNKRRELSVSHPLGYFSLLPTELQHAILSRLNLVELSYLSVTNKQMCEVIEGFRLTPNGIKKFYADNSIHQAQKTLDWPTTYIQNYFQLGLYMKRSSCLKSTAKRLKQASFYLLENLMCGSECGDGRKCISFYCYGTFLHTLIAGWDDLECLRVLDYLTSNTSVRRYLMKLFSAPPGVHSHIEVYVRCFYRRAFIDVLRKSEDKTFWLFHILKPLPMIYQARLLAILFLPKTTVGINWFELTSRTLNKDSFSDLGSALVLLSESNKWNNDTIISVIDEITAIPVDWHAENKSYLLLNCGQTITYNVLLSKTINNRLAEIIKLSYHLIVASVKSHQTIKQVTPTLWKLIEHMKSNERLYYSTELLSTFKDAALDIDAVQYDQEAAVEAMTQFAQELLDMALKSIQINGLPPSTFTKLNDSQQADLSGDMVNPEE